MTSFDYSQVTDAGVPANFGKFKMAVNTTSIGCARRTSGIGDYF